MLEYQLRWVRYLILATLVILTMGKWRGRDFRYYDWACHPDWNCWKYSTATLHFSRRSGFRRFQQRIVDRKNKGKMTDGALITLRRSMRRPDSKVHGAYMGPTWVLSAPDGPHVGPMNLAIRRWWWWWWWGGVVEGGGWVGVGEWVGVGVGLGDGGREDRVHWYEVVVFSRLGQM